MAYGVPGLNMHALGMTQTLFGKGGNHSSERQLILRSHKHRSDQQDQQPGGHEITWASSHRQHIGTPFALRATSPPWARLEP